MKKTKKVVAAIILIVFVLIIFTGCDNFDNNEVDTYSNDSVDIPISENDNPVTLINGKVYFDLSRMGELRVTMADLENFQLSTNSTQISVSISQSEYSGTITLYETFNDLEVQTFSLDQNNRAGVFTNLTSAKNYYITASGFDDTTFFVISDR